MEPTIKHIITPRDLSEYRDVFPNEVFIGEEIELTPEQYDAIGLEVHTLTAEDIQSNEMYERLGLAEGDTIEREKTLENNEDESSTQ